MAIRDRIRRFTRSDRSSSSSSETPSPTPLSQAPTVPTPPTPPLAKSTSRLSLSKTLTFHSSSRKHKKEESRDQRLQEWEKKDKAEWKQPSVRRPGRKSQVHVDMLRAFEWGSGDGCGGKEKEGSVWSGISPCTSRIGSVDDECGKMGLGIERVMSGGSGMGVKRMGSRTTHVERLVEE